MARYYRGNLLFALVIQLLRDENSQISRLLPEFFICDFINFHSNNVSNKKKSQNGERVQK